MTMRKTRRKENEVLEGGEESLGADKVTTRRKTRRRQKDEDNDIFVAALQNNVSAPPQLLLRVPLRFKAAPIAGRVVNVSQDFWRVSWNHRNCGRTR